MLAAAGTLVLLALPASAVWLLAARRGVDWRVGLGWAALAWSAWAVLVSELLSVGDGRFDRGWLLAAWAAPALAATALLMRERADVGRRFAAARYVIRACPRGERLLLAGIASCLTLTLLVALVAAPNNWDSHVYHLARVAVWEQLGDVRHVATNVDPQNYQPPGAELLIAQGHVISGGDRLAALVQWFAYAGSIALAGTAVGALGGGRRAQLAAATLVATAPPAILEASSTQNDLVLGFWLLLAATLAADIWTRGRAIPAGALGASLALGMAALTKGTGMLFGAPIGALLAIAVVRRVGVRRAAALATAGLVLFALPNLGQWWRNAQTYGTPVATSHAGLDNPYRVQDPGPGTLAANLVRNATNHLDMPFDAGNRAIERGARALLDAIGQDADDPRTTFLGQPFRVGPFGPHEDHAGSLLLLMLGLWAAGSTILATARRQRSSGIQVWWLGVITAQVLLFCLLITWQNWHVRMHLPVMLLVAVLVAARLEHRRRALWAACIVALAMAPLYLVFNVTRPLVGSDSILTQSRTTTMFLPRPQLQAPYEEVVDRLARRDVRDVGLVTSIDDWHYPLHRLGADREQPVRFREVLTSGPSSEPGAATVDDVEAAVCVRCVPGQQQALQQAGFRPVELDAGGPRRGRGDDVTTVELWLGPDVGAP